MRVLILCAIALCLGAVGAQAPEALAADAENLRIIGKDTSYTVQTEHGAVEITRVMTPCAKNKGWLQPLVPVEGVHPVSEIEVLEALNDDSFLVVDMREIDWHIEATIPGSINIPYTEISQRLDELGCKGKGESLDCATAKKVLGYCNGPVCPQSPSAMKAMVREGFPADKIYYYRGGMLAWDALGLTTVGGSM